MVKPARNMEATQTKDGKWIAVDDDGAVTIVEPKCSNQDMVPHWLSGDLAPPDEAEAFRASIG